MLVTTHGTHLTATMYSIGTTLTYTAFDEESYSRGYGARFESRTSRISEIRFKVDTHYQDIGVPNILSDNKTPSLGEDVKYQFWDGEEGRSYGWFLAQKEGKITEIFYRMENGDSVHAKDILEVKALPAKKE
jgi:hypothetical protein